MNSYNVYCNIILFWDTFDTLISLNIIVNWCCPIISITSRSCVIARMGILIWWYILYPFNKQQPFWLYHFILKMISPEVVLRVRQSINTNIALSWKVLIKFFSKYERSVDSTWLWHDHFTSKILSQDINTHQKTQFCFNAYTYSLEGIEPLQTI